MNVTGRPKPTEPTKPTKESLFDALEEQAAADEAERIRALSDEALDLELSRDGLDPAAERARGRHLGAVAASRGARTSISTARWATLLAATLGAFALAAAFGAGRRGLRGVSEAVPDVARSAPSARAPLPPPPSPSPLERAASLRAEGLRACAAGSLGACEDLLDEARALDPAGERGPEVARARRAIDDAVRAADRKTAPR